MKHTIVGGLVFCVFALTWAAPAAHAQFKLAAQNISLADTTITPADPSVLAATSSGEIMALDVPPVPSSGYVLLSSTAFWQVNTTAAAPVSAFFRMRFVVTSPAMPPGVILNFSAVMADFSHSNNGNGESLEGGSAEDSEVLTRDALAAFLLIENPSTLNAVTAGQVADGLFQRGFHVSVSTRLSSRNITDATVINPNVAFFAEKNSQAKQ